MAATTTTAPQIRAVAVTLDIDDTSSSSKLEYTQSAVTGITDQLKENQKLLDEFGNDSAFNDYISHKGLTNPFNGLRESSQSLIAAFTELGNKSKFTGKNLSGMFIPTYESLMRSAQKISSAQSKIMEAFYAEKRIDDFYTYRKVTKDTKQANRAVEEAKSGIAQVKQNTGEIALARGMAKEELARIYAAEGRDQNGKRVMSQRAAYGHLSNKQFADLAPQLLPILGKEVRRYQQAHPGGSSYDMMTQEFAKPEHRIHQQVRTLVGDKLKDEDISNIIRTTFNLYGDRGFASQFRDLYESYAATSRPAASLAEKLPNRLTKMVNTMLEGRYYTSPQINNDEVMNTNIRKGVYSKLLRVASSKGSGDIINEALVKAGVATRDNANYVYSNTMTYAQANELAAILTDRIIQSQTGQVGYVNDLNDPRAARIRANRSNKTNDAIYQALDIINHAGGVDKSGNPLFAPGYMHDEDKIMPGAFTGGSVRTHKHSQVRGDKEYYYIPATYIGDDGKLVYRTPGEWDPRADFRAKKLAYYQKHDIPDPEVEWVSMASSELTRALGLRGTGTYGFGRDEKRNPLTPIDQKTGMYAPPIIQIETDQMYIRDDKGNVIGFDDPTHTMSKFYNREAGGELEYGGKKYVFGYQNKTRAYAIEQEMFNDIVKHDERAGLTDAYNNAYGLGPGVNRFNNFNIINTGLTDKDAMKQIDVSRKIATESVGLAEGYGIDLKALKKRTHIWNTEAMYEALGIPENTPEKGGFRIDGMSVLVKGNDIDIPDGFAAQIRDLGPTIKGVLQHVDPKMLLKAFGLLTEDEYETDTLGNVKLDSNGNKIIKRAATVRNSNIYKNVNGQDQLWLPGQSATAEIVRSVITGRDINDQIIPQDQIDEMIKTYFFNALDKDVGVIHTDSTVKNLDKFKVATKEWFDARYGAGAAEKSGRLISYEEYAKMKDINISHWSDAEKQKKGIVRLVEYDDKTGREISDYIQDSRDTVGDLVVVRGASEFRTNKDYMSYQEFVAAGASDRMREASHENYNAERAYYKTMAGRKDIVMQDAELRQRYKREGEALLMSDEVSARITEKLDELDNEEYNLHRILRRRPSQSRDQRSLGTESMLAVVSPEDIVDPIARMIFNQDNALDNIEGSMTTGAKQMRDANRKNKMYVANTGDDDYNKDIRGQAMTNRIPSAPGTMNVVRVITSGPSAEFLGDLGYSPDALALTVAQHFKHNTGDFDGDTVRLYFALLNEDLEKIKQINDAVDEAGKKYNASRPDKKKNKNDAHKDVVSGDNKHIEYGARSIEATRAMGTASDLIKRAALLPDEDPDKYPLLYAASRAYDFATTYLKEPGENGFLLPPELMGLFSTGRLQDKADKILDELNATDKIRNRLPVMSLRFAPASDRMSMFATNLMQKGILNSKNLSVFGSHDFTKIADAMYEEGTAEHAASTWLMRLAQGVSSGMHFVNDKDISEGDALYDALQDRIMLLDAKRDKTSDEKDLLKLLNEEKSYMGTRLKDFREGGAGTKLNLTRRRVQLRNLLSRNDLTDAQRKSFEADDKVLQDLLDNEEKAQELWENQKRMSVTSDQLDRIEREARETKVKKAILAAQKGYAEGESNTVLARWIRYADSLDDNARRSIMSSSYTSNKYFMKDVDPLKDVQFTNPVAGQTTAKPEDVEFEPGEKKYLYEMIQNNVARALGLNVEKGVRKSTRWGSVIGDAVNQYAKSMMTGQTNGSGDELRDFIIQHIMSGKIQTEHDYGRKKNYANIRDYLAEVGIMLNPGAKNGLEFVADDATEEKYRKLMYGNGTGGVTGAQNIFNQILDPTQYTIVGMEDEIFDDAGKQIQNSVLFDFNGNNNLRKASIRPDFFLKDKNGKFTIVDLKSSEKGGRAGLFQAIVYAKQMEMMSKRIHEGTYDTSKMTQQEVDWWKQLGHMDNGQFVSNIDTVRTVSMTGETANHKIDEAYKNNLYKSYEDAVKHHDMLLANDYLEYRDQINWLESEDEWRKKYRTRDWKPAEKGSFDEARVLYYRDRFNRSLEAVKETRSDLFKRRKSLMNEEMGPFDQFKYMREKLQAPLEKEELELFMSNLIPEAQNEFRDAESARNAALEEIDRMQLISALKTPENVSKNISRIVYGLQDNKGLETFDALTRQIADAKAQRDALMRNEKFYDQERFNEASATLYEEILQGKISPDEHGKRLEEARNNSWVLDEYKKTYEEANKRIEEMEKTAKDTLPLLLEKDYKADQKSYDSLLNMIQGKHADPLDSIRNYYDTLHEKAEDYVRQQEKLIEDLKEKLDQRVGEGKNAPFKYTPSSPERAALEQRLKNAENRVADAKKELSPESMLAGLTNVTNDKIRSLISGTVSMDNVQRTRMDLLNSLALQREEIAASYNQIRDSSGYYDIKTGTYGASQEAQNFKAKYEADIKNALDNFDKARKELEDKNLERTTDYYDAKDASIQISREELELEQRRRQPFSYTSTTLSNELDSFLSTRDSAKVTIERLALEQRALEKQIDQIDDDILNFQPDPNSKVSEDDQRAAFELMKGRERTGLNLQENLVHEKISSALSTANPSYLDIPRLLRFASDQLKTSDKQRLDIESEITGIENPMIPFYDYYNNIRKTIRTFITGRNKEVNRLEELLAAKRYDEEGNETDEYVIDDLYQREELQNLLRQAREQRKAMSKFDDDNILVDNASQKIEHDIRNNSNIIAGYGKDYSALSSIIVGNYQANRDINARFDALRDTSIYYDKDIQDYKIHQKAQDFKKKLEDERQRLLDLQNETYNKNYMELMRRMMFEDTMSEQTSNLQIEETMDAFAEQNKSERDRRYKGSSVVSNEIDRVLSDRKRQSARSKRLQLSVSEIDEKITRAKNDIANYVAKGETKEEQDLDRNAYEVTRNAEIADLERRRNNILTEMNEINTQLGTEINGDQWSHLQNLFKEQDTSYQATYDSVMQKILSRPNPMAAARDYYNNIANSLDNYIGSNEKEIAKLEELLKHTTDQGKQDEINQRILNLRNNIDTARRDMSPLGMSKGLIHEANTYYTQRMRSATSMSQAQSRIIADQTAYYVNRNNVSAKYDELLSHAKPGDEYDTISREYQAAMDKMEEANRNAVEAQLRESRDAYNNKMRSMYFSSMRERNQFERSARQRNERPFSYGIFYRNYSAIRAERENLEDSINAKSLERDAAAANLDRLKSQTYIKDDNLTDAENAKLEQIWNDEQSKRIKEAETQVNNLDDAIKRYRDRISEIPKDMDAWNAAWMTLQETSIRTLTNMARRITRIAMQEAKRFVVEFNKIISEIQVVTLGSDEQMDAISSNILNTAVKYKSDPLSVAKSAVMLYRQGLSEEEVNNRMEAITKFSTVSGVNADVSSRLLTVALNGGMVDSVAKVFDTITAISDSMPTNPEEITKAFQRSMFSAKANGTSYDELAAMVAAITSKTQLSGSIAGTTMARIFSRMRNVRNGDEIVYDDNNIAIASTDVSRALRLANVDLYDKSTGEMRSTFNVLSDLGKVWEDLDSTTKGKISNAIAGSGRQAQNFDALMDAFTTVDESGKRLIDTLIEIAKGADGIVDSKVDIHLKSLDAAMKELKASFDQLVEGLHLDELVTPLFNFISYVLQGLSAINDLSQGFIGMTAIAATLATVVQAIAGAAASAGIASFGGIPAIIAGGVIALGALAKGISDFVNGIKNTAEDVPAESKYIRVQNARNAIDNIVSAHTNDKGELIEGELSAEEKSSANSALKVLADENVIERSTVIESLEDLAKATQKATNAMRGFDNSAGLEDFKEAPFGMFSWVENLVKGFSSYEKVLRQYHSNFKAGDFTDTDLDQLYGKYTMGQLERDVRYNAFVKAIVNSGVIDKDDSMTKEEYIEAVISGKDNGKYRTDFSNKVFGNYDWRNDIRRAFFGRTADGQMDITEAVKNTLGYFMSDLNIDGVDDKTKEALIEVMADDIVYRNKNDLNRSAVSKAAYVELVNLSNNPYKYYDRYKERVDMALASKEDKTIDIAKVAYANDNNNYLMTSRARAASSSLAEMMNARNIPAGEFVNLDSYYTSVFRNFISGQGENLLSLVSGESKESKALATAISQYNQAVEKGETISKQDLIALQLRIGAMSDAYGGSQNTSEQIDTYRWAFERFRSDSRVNASNLLKDEQLSQQLTQDLLSYAGIKRPEDILSMSDDSYRYLQMKMDAEARGLKASPSKKFIAQAARKIFEDNSYDLQNTTPELLQLIESSFPDMSEYLAIKNDNTQRERREKLKKNIQKQIDKLYNFMENASEQAISWIEDLESDNARTRYNAKFEIENTSKQNALLSSYIKRIRNNDIDSGIITSIAEYIPGSSLADVRHMLTADPNAIADMLVEIAADVNKSINDTVDYLNATDENILNIQKGKTLSKATEAYVNNRDQTHSDLTDPLADLIQRYRAQGFTDLDIINGLLSNDNFRKFAEAGDLSASTVFGLQERGEEITINDATNAIDSILNTSGRTVVSGKTYMAQIQEISEAFNELRKGNVQGLTGLDAITEERFALLDEHRQKQLRRYAEGIKIGTSKYDKTAKAREAYGILNQIKSGTYNFNLFEDLVPEEIAMLNEISNNILGSVMQDVDRGVLKVGSDEFNARYAEAQSAIIRNLFSGIGLDETGNVAAIIANSNVDFSSYLDMISAELKKGMSLKEYLQALQRINDNVARAEDYAAVANYLEIPEIDVRNQTRIFEEKVKQNIDERNRAILELIKQLSGVDVSAMISGKNAVSLRQAIDVVFDNGKLKDSLEYYLETAGYDIDAPGLKLDATPVIESLQQLINDSARSLIDSNDTYQMRRINEIAQSASGYAEFNAQMTAEMAKDPAFKKYVEGNESFNKLLVSAIGDTNFDMTKIQGNGGNVDIQHRLTTKGLAMQNAGWSPEEFEADADVTLAGRSYSGEFKNGQAYSISFTPVLPNGKPATPQEFAAYVDKIFSFNSFEDALAFDAANGKIIIDNERMQGLDDQQAIHRLNERDQARHLYHAAMISTIGKVNGDEYLGAATNMEYAVMQAILNRMTSGTFGQNMLDYDFNWNSMFGSGFDNMSNWSFDALTSNMSALASSNNPADVLMYGFNREVLGNFESGKTLLELLDRIMSGLAVDAGAVTDAMKALNNELGYKAINAANNASESYKRVSSTLEAIREGGTKAAEAQQKFDARIEEFNNMQAAYNKYMAGARDEITVSNMAKLSGKESNVIKNANAKKDKFLFDDIEYNARIKLNTEGVELADDFSTTITGMINQGLMEIADKDPTLTQNILVDGQFDITAFLQTLAQVDSNLSEAINAFLKQWEHVEGTVNIQMNAALSGGNLTKDSLAALFASGGSAVDVTATAPTGKKYYGTGKSGGGGSGKSATDKLLERLKHGQSLYEHVIKMYNYEETRYQNLDQLTNYGRVLEGEIEVEKSYLPVLQSNIAAMKEQMNTVTEGGEDWYKLRDAILDAEEKYADITNTIDENNKKLKENQQAILKTHTDLEEMVVAEIEKRIQRQRDMLAGNVDMQENVLKAIKESYQKQWDIIKMDIDRKKKALEEEKALIDERLNKRKSAEDEAAKYEELAKLKAQYASVSMDSSRTKDAASLRKQIQDLEKEIGWDMADAEAKAMSDAIQDQIDAYDEFASTGDEDLDKLLEDANNFGTEVTRILGMSHDDLMTWLKSNDTEYGNSLGVAQEQILQAWDDTWKQMYGIVDTWWPEVNEILSSESSFINYMSQSIDYTTASLDQQKQMMYEWAEAYRVYMQAYIDTANFSHIDPNGGNWSGSEYTGVSSNGSGGSSTGGGGSSNAGNSAKITTSPNKTVTTTNQMTGTQFTFAPGNGSGGNYYVQYEDLSNGSINRKYGYTSQEADALLKQMQAYVDAGLIRGISKGSTSALLGQTNAADYQSPTVTTTNQTSSVNGTATVSASSGSAKLRSGPSTDYAQKGTVSDGQKLTIIGKSGNWYQTTNGWISGNLLKNIKTYASGGEADFTGLIKIDGTTDKPERILDWQQTRSFNELTSVLSSSALEDLHSALQFMDSWSQFASVIPKLLSFDMSSMSSPTSNNNFGDIVVNLYEAKLEEDADYDLVAEKVGKLFSKELSKQGFNTRFSY